MSNLIKHLKRLKTKVNIVREALKNADLAEQAEAQKKEEQEETDPAIETEVSAINIKVQEAALNKSMTSQEASSLFTYKVESGMPKDLKPIPEISKFSGKGLRITSYIGFDTEKIVIPDEIDGQPVISIGEKVFYNTAISEVILPQSIKIILDRAFSKCRNLKHIDLPESIEYLGSYCFAESELEEITFPHLLKIIPNGCCSDSHHLSSVTFEDRLEKIGYSAFDGCPLESVTLPDSLLEIDSHAFRNTDITTIIFPSAMKQIAGNAFEDLFSGRRKIKKVCCVFLGENTDIKGGSFCNVSLIYCLPGSKIQQEARIKYNKRVKPLSEFRPEEHE